MLRAQVNAKCVAIIIIIVIIVIIVIVIIVIVTPFDFGCVRLRSTLMNNHNIMNTQTQTLDFIVYFAALAARLLVGRKCCANIQQCPRPFT